jgi:hypothetical protein
MPSKTNVKYVVTKVDHDFGLSNIRPNFQRMAELYLELLVNKKKVNCNLASEKYVHTYEPAVLSIEEPYVDNGIYSPINRVSSSIYKNKVPRQHPEQKGTPMWESSDSMEPSPVRLEKIPRVASSSIQLEESASTTRYRKSKKSVISSYYGTRRGGEGPGTRRGGEDVERPQKLTVDYDHPPPLKEIKRNYDGNRPRVDDLNDATSTKDEDDRKRELLFKFTRLRKNYPAANVPDFNMLSNHDNMKRTYDTTIKNLAIDSNVESYKTYLIIFFMGTEMALGKVGLDMEGYTQQQTLQMNKYEKLLVELEEKSYMPNAVSKWSVEMRLVFLSLTQTALFVVSKLVASKTNFNILSAYNNVTLANKNKAENSISRGGGGSSPITLIPKSKGDSQLSSSNNGPVGSSSSSMRGPSASR